MDCVELFESSLESKETRNSYMLLLKKYMDFIGLNDPFFESNPRSIERKIIEFIISMKEKGKSYPAIRNYVAAIIAFYKINDVILNVTKIGKRLVNNYQNFALIGSKHRQ